MTWPRGAGGKFSPKTDRWRRALLGIAQDGEQALTQAEAMQEGLKQLALRGARGSAGRWWAFEGSTKVDCYFATEKLCLYVEGKRTESLSPATAWYPARNQFVRNLEAAREDAAGRPFACMLMSEVPLVVPSVVLASGLPHFTEEQRSQLLRHYVGNVTWENACLATGLSFASLPVCCE